MASSRTVPKAVLRWIRAKTANRMMTITTTPVVYYQVAHPMGMTTVIASSPLRMAQRSLDSMREHNA